MNDVESITFASSACVYPTHIQEDKCLLTEEMVSFDKPGGAFADEEYGWAKLMGELSLQAFHRQYGTRTGCARISTAYGPRENESHAMIALIAKAFIQQSPFQIWGSGEQSRGFTYVDDVARGILLVGEKINDGRAINIGSSEFISLNRVAEEIFNVMDWRPDQGIEHLQKFPVGVTHRALDATNAIEQIGWSPQVQLTEGLRKTIDWYQANHDRAFVAANLEQMLMQR